MTDFSFALQRIETLGTGHQVTVHGLPEGYDALFLSNLARGNAYSDVLHICRDDVRLATLAAEVRFFVPDLDVLVFPAWDCVPYDRVSPSADLAAQRTDTLTRLAGPHLGKPRLVITTVAAVTQRVPGKRVFNGAVFRILAGKRLNVDALMGYLVRNGYTRSGQVMEPGEYAVRGGIIDLYPPGTGEPLRLDLFGDDVDTIRTFDPLTQRSTGNLDEVLLKPMSEVILTEDSIARFRTRYRELFGAPSKDDLLYEAVSAGRTVQGIEHWMPLFHDGLDTLFAYLPQALVTCDHQFEQAWEARIALIREYFDARISLNNLSDSVNGTVYHPIRPEWLFMEPDEFPRLLKTVPSLLFSPFAAPDVGSDCVDAGGRPGRDFADVRARHGENVYDAVQAHIGLEQGKGNRVVIAALSYGSRDRLTGVLRDHGVQHLSCPDDWEAACKQTVSSVPVVVLGLDHGFFGPGFVLLAEQDILGDRLARPSTRKRQGKADAFIRDASALAEGDLVVHAEHGIGRYVGLENLDIGGAAHDCLCLVYDGGDKLFVPVENIDVLTRYGSEQGGVSLDRLGSPAWQSRKAQLKQRIRDMADQLIQVAAQRQLRDADVLTVPDGLFDEFCARFPYAETDDQLKAIADTLDDMAKGQPMDRLVCGDVGFGKTEVALRAAFVAAMSGTQVAVVVPTTLLARQHYQNFIERFRDMPVRIAQLSRLVSAKDAARVREELEKGTLDIVIGTHAVVSKSVKFQRLGLLIVDEEQHFGVAHKEQLKQLKADVHVLTLSATPIPRTLQLALTGVRELSLIATPPVDRLTVRTFVMPFDGVVIREAILRERYRGGQSFFVCPRLADIDKAVEQLKVLVPEVRTIVAHGQMSAGRLEEVMKSFADGDYDILVATNIIESGLDMPRVNTIIIHRADMFGLSQLYQLRGRVGRGKQRGYAYLTLPPGRILAPAAEKRLTVMQTLDTLGAGFSLASHDMDIRGAGNLLGDEQSGHIKEVGIELYQTLLQEAVAAARKGEGSSGEESRDSGWSPQISLGIPVLLPEDYIKDLSVRLGLYRRIAELQTPDEIENLMSELVDRFGPLPPEARNLLSVVGIRQLCLRAHMEKVDAGPKGAVLTLRGNTFPNPEGLVRFISQNIALVKVRPDHKIVYVRHWPMPEDRMAGLYQLMENLAKVAEEVTACL
ncbi:transcription-repair coupling factor [Haematospirillum jordaniae]|uniref:transcription-repair coupling factor n=1 Tax=Haematospirillum jordaniae TaxID=1549855 RepID=UPI002AC369CE|nr:transcription-repair coupling factor [Haematospirillum jordaniae]